MVTTSFLTLLTTTALMPTPHILGFCPSNIEELSMERDENYKITV